MRVLRQNRISFIAQRMFPPDASCTCLSRFFGRRPAVHVPGILARTNDNILYEVQPRLGQVLVLGVDLSELVLKRKISLDDLSGRSLAVDAYNTLYQFLAIIRQPDGTPLMDRERRITSHLSGVLYRTANLGEKGIRVAYVFDGKPPELKEMEIKRRRKIREEAALKYEDAMRAGRIEDARKYAQATATLKELMVEDSKKLLKALGIPWVQAPSEGEAQAAHMAAKGDVWAAASQDHDSLLFGAPRMLKNLTISGRRKLPGRQAYVEVEPELLNLEEILADLGITRQQLIEVGILVGTDYNPDGIKGVGPKTALKLIKEHGDLVSMTAKNVDLLLPENVNRIEEFFMKPVVTSSYALTWKEPDSESVVEFLCGERDFSEDRVRKALERMRTGLEKPSTKPTLDRYFG